MTTRWEDTQLIVESLKPLNGKVLLDCTNPEHPEKLELVIGHTTSGGEEVARWAASARVVKTLNHVYAEVLYAGARFGDQAATIFVCGDDVAAKHIAADLIRDLGFEPVDAGGLRNARYLEPLAELIVQLVRVMGCNPADTAFHLLSRS